MRFADRIDFFFPMAHCPACKHGMPGNHARHCPVRAAALDIERNVTTDAGRRAVIRFLNAMGKKDWAPMPKSKHPENNEE
jgi:hypothetical protein